jgi:6-methylsalicylate decarboxylase
VTDAVQAAVQAGEEVAAMSSGTQDGAQRIDVHQHVVPPSYRDWLDARGINAAGGYPIPAWNVDTALTTMHANGIRTGVLSVSTPGVSVGDFGARTTVADARSQARSVNEYVAEVVRDHPGRFGLFATLTLPDVDGALAEAAYAFDTLHADGVIVLANVQGRYLGDPAFDPLLAELDRRHAVVLLHPSTLPGPRVPGVAPFMADFLLDTVRAALQLTTSGAMDRYPHLKIILAHAGGFLPYVAYRVAPFMPDSTAPDFTPAGFARGTDLLRRFWFDVALSASPATLPSLLAFADPTKVVYGSDSPFAPAPVVQYMARSLDDFPLGDGQRAAVNRTNAHTLFPRLS